MTNDQFIRFTKMHGLGNDFVIINATKNQLDVSKLPIQKLSNRHVGIGFDQLLVLEPSTKADFFCRIFNADASEAEQCGNGLRCLARYIHESGLRQQTSLTLETKAGVFPIQIEDYDRIRVTLATPELKPQQIEFASKLSPHTLPVSILSMGNPHAIVKVDSMEIPAHEIGLEIAALPFFSNGANVGFMQIMDHHHIRLRTFERGVGETFACGSNACAAAIVGMMNGWLQTKVDVQFHYGSLSIEWQGKDAPIHMIGPAAFVYSGEFAGKAI